MKDPEDMERLAAVEHQSWSGWVAWELEQIEKELNQQLPPRPSVPGIRVHGDGERIMEALNRLPCVQRWRRQLKTPYQELSEQEKESDRKVVREKLSHYRPHRDWCNCDACCQERQDSEAWREVRYAPPYYSQRGVAYRHRCPHCLRPRALSGLCDSCREEEEHARSLLVDEWRGATDPDDGGRELLP